MTKGFVQFKGTAEYVTSPALSDAVNVAYALERPRMPQTLRHVTGQHGLARPRFTLEQQRPFQRVGNIDGVRQRR